MDACSTSTSGTTTWVDYVSAAAGTAIYPGCGHNVIYPVLGLAGEISELVTTVEVERAAELGDVVWYVAALSGELGIDPSRFDAVALFDPVPGGSPPVVPLVGSPVVAQLVASSGRIVEHVKKMMRDDAGILTVQRRELIVAELDVVVSCVSVVAAVCGTTLAAVFDANLSKLAGRARRNTLTGDGDHR